MSETRWDAMTALLDYSKLRDTEHVEAYRSGEFVLVTDGALVLRVKPGDPDELEAFQPFTKQAEIDAMRFPVKLFRVDTTTLADWARNETPLIGECSECDGGKVEVDEIDGEPCDPTTVDCFECDGTMATLGRADYGWLTTKRLVDRRYVELIAAIARDHDVIDVRAQSHDVESGIRFRGPDWSALLMPCRDNGHARDVTPPLWRPQPVLEGENA